MASLLTACSGGGEKKAESHAQQQQAPPTVPKPVSDVAVLIEQKEQKVGQEVTLRDVAVQDSGEQNSKQLRQLWVGPSSSEQILIVYPPDAVPLAKGKEQKLSRGSVVSVAGTLKKAPESAKAQRDWHLNKDEAAQLAQTGVYVEAKSVMPQGG